SPSRTAHASAANPWAASSFAELSSPTRAHKSRHVRLQRCPCPIAFEHSFFRYQPALAGFRSCLPPALAGGNEALCIPISRLQPASHATDRALAHVGSSEKSFEPQPG